MNKVCYQVNNGTLVNNLFQCERVLNLFCNENNLIKVWEIKKDGLYLLGKIKPIYEINSLGYKVVNPLNIGEAL